MARRRKRKSGPQLEFVALVEAAEAASSEMAARLRAQRSRERAQRQAMRALEAPRRFSHGFDGSWIRDVAARIKQAGSLREGIALAASWLSMLLDMEIEEEDQAVAWWEKYDAFCAKQKNRYGLSEDVAYQKLYGFWEVTEEFFKLYYALNSMNDWQLFEEVCSGEGEDFDGGDFARKQAYLLEDYAEIVVWMHIILANYPVEEAPTRGWIPGS
jgi:hypothetical protein